MAKYISRPIIIEATRWFKHGDHSAVIPHSALTGAGKTRGGMIVQPGDYIAESDTGQISVMPPDMFAQSFEKIDDNTYFREGPDCDAKEGDLVTARPIVISAGAKVGHAPQKTSYGTSHGSVLVGFGPDATGDMRFDIEEAIEAGAIKRFQTPEGTK